MKIKSFFALLIILIWGACQSPSIVYQPQFVNFKVQKITEKGIEAVDVQFNKLENWPDTHFLPAEKINFSYKKIKIAVLGDTGCRLKETTSKNSYQKCSDTTEWPYAQVIQSIVKENFDFAIHTGDYHYREQCSDPVLCSAYTKSIGYGWSAWWDDFYGPTQALFKKAPILLVRGNHEDCNRAYSGWNILSPLNRKFTEACEEIEPYQWIEMGDLIFINFDDSAYEDRKEMSPAEQQKHLNVLMKIHERIDLVSTKKEIWFLAHKPVYAYTADKKNRAEIKPITPNLQNAMQTAGLLNKVDYILSGHIHNQQLVLNKDSLAQIIVGHSGSALDPFNEKIKNKKLISTTYTPFSFGYALFERQGFKKWKMQFKNTAGQLEMQCLVVGKKISCD